MIKLFIATFIFANCVWTFENWVLMKKYEEKISEAYQAEDEAQRILKFHYALECRVRPEFFHR